jgi:hypothetical protein
MRTEFAASVAKDSRTPQDNEDRFALSGDGLRLALCDGASESFDSKRWADILARRFTEDPRITQEWVAEAVHRYAAAHDFATMSWSRQAAFARGSFATLLGVEDDPGHNAVDVLAIGDSIALLLSGVTLLGRWPLMNPEHFSERPTLLATIPALNDFVGADGFWSIRGTTFHLDGVAAARLLCTTDALGEWALRQALGGGEGLAELLRISSADEFAQLVERERSARRMRIDDATMVVLSFERERQAHALPLV